ncbi:MAG: hypothetical protein LBT32_02865 [Peptococcaceae bacterium]|jgi:hypothetical protein|nr:hypothetical protein [Peptococcaceae bacterium]
MKELSEKDCEECQDFFAPRSKILAAYVFEASPAEFSVLEAAGNIAVLFAEPMTAREEDALQDEVQVFFAPWELACVHLRALPLVLQYRVIAAGVLLWASDDVAYTDFVEQVLLAYGAYRSKVSAFIEDCQQTWQSAVDPKEEDG